MSDQRSTAAVGRQLGKTKTLMDRWSARHRWVDRVAAYESHLDRIKQEAAEEAVREMGERHANIAVQGLNLVIQRLIGSEGIGKIGAVDKIDANSLSPHELVRFAEVFARMEREARGFAMMSESIDFDMPAEALVDMTDPDDQDKVIELAEWIAARSG